MLLFYIINMYELIIQIHVLDFFPLILAVTSYGIRKRKVKIPEKKIGKINQRNNNFSEVSCVEVPKLEQWRRKELKGNCEFWQFWLQRMSSIHCIALL